MERRDFIRILGVSSSIIAGTGLACTSTNKPNLKNWAWLGGGKDNTDEELMAFFQKMKDNRIHGILPGGSNEYYKRIAPMAKQVGLDLHCWR